MYAFETDHYNLIDLFFNYKTGLRKQMLLLKLNNTMYAADVSFSNILEQHFLLS